MIRGTAAAGTGAAALGLVGCGDDDDDDGGSNSTVAPAGSATSATTSQASKTAAAVKKGGTLQVTATTEPPTLDPYANTSGYTKIYAGFSYSRLFMYKRGPELKTPDEYRVEGDLAESYKLSDDKLTYTIKLRPNAKWHPPIARAVNADDIVYSWRRFTGQITGTPVSANATVLNGIIDTVRAVDPQTVEIKTKRPAATFTGMLADGNDFWIMPAETGTAFNPTEKLVGSGPFVFESYRAGVSATWTRNPSWHLAGPDGAPYVDKLEIAQIKDTTTALNQFIAGNLDLPAITGAADLSTYQQIAAVKGIQTQFGPPTGSNFLIFSTQTKGAPWQDERVRQAMSMAIDRDLLAEGVNNLSRAKQAGAKFDPKWSGVISAIYGKYWVDPKTDASIAKYFKFDPAEAKKLLSAAGYPNGFEAKFVRSNAYGAVALLEAEIVQQMMTTNLGLKLTADVQDYSVYVRGQMIGQYDQIGIGPTSGREDPGDQLESIFRKGGSANRSQVDDPEIERRLNEIQADFDGESRLKKIREFQTYAAQKMYYSNINASVALYAYGPKLRNAFEYQNGIGVNPYGFPTERWAFAYKEG